MKNNHLTVKIDRPISEVFNFAITPPNSTRWILGVVKEETTEWPVRVGTIYRLQDEGGNISEVTVVDIKENEKVEWVSSDRNYHCCYQLRSLGQDATELKYSEWVGRGEIKGPFTQKVLERFKKVLET